MLALGTIVDDVIVHIQILLPQGYGQFVDHQPGIKVFLDDTQSVLSVAEIKK